MGSNLSNLNEMAKTSADYYNNLSWGKSLIQNKIDIKSSDIKNFLF